jgi:murein tripeptide amidase MpaA
MKYCALLFILSLPFQSFSQNDSLKKLTMSGYGELYYSYDFSNPQNHEKENFLYNHKRHNEVNVNLLYVKASYLENNYRANLGFMAGNYAQYNLATEPDWAQFIYEANIGWKVSKKQNIWLDAGIMPSHIGFESAVSADCWTLTRSLLAENSPYYESGIKLYFRE